MRYSSRLPALVALVAAALAAPASAAPPPRVVASTSWTAAFVRAAGVEDVRVLTPYALRHPSDYVVRPSDLLAVRDADVVVYAGYEAMAPRLVEAADGTGARLVKIDTRNDPATVAVSLAVLGDVLGTRAAAAAAAARVAAFVTAWREELRAAGLAGAVVVTHQFQRPLAEALGFAVAGTFGPAPLEAAGIVGLARIAPILLVDTWHNEAGRPLAEALPGTPYVSWLNFPVDPERPGLLDVLEENRRRLADALR
jgi:ABC-type Fe3+-hydroxamate transport system substrate-binding protein